MKNFKATLLIPAVFLFSIVEAQNKADSSLVIREAVVSARKGASGYGSGTIVIHSGEIKSSLALLGEADILKVIQLLPGVQAGTEGLSGIYVRGGGADENLILLDGIPVHCQGHLLGLLSPFQSEAIEDVTVHKGVFPARFGGKASGVLDFQTARPPDDGRKRLCLGIGSLSDKIHLSGKTAGGKISYSVSGRGMHTLLMDGAFKAFKIPANLYFHDLHAKAEWCIDSGNSLCLNFFDSKDKLYYSEEDQKTDVAWGTMMAAAGWKKRWNPNLWSEMTLASSGYSMGTGIKPTSGHRDSYRTGMVDLIVKTGFIFSGIKEHNIRFGGETIRHVFTPEADFGDNLSGDLNPTYHETGYEAAIYMEDRIKAVSWLTIDAGLRVAAFRCGGTTRAIPEPRLSFSAGKAPGPVFTLGYGRVSQHIHQLSSPIAVLPVDMIVPVTKSIGPEVSDQVCAGLSLNRPTGFEVSLEAYWKGTSGVLEFKDGIAFIDDFKTWEEDVAIGKGRSYGIELYARKSEGKTKGWLGYTLSKSERRCPGGLISGGEWFPARHDCRHSGTLVIERDLGRGWEAGATWTYSTGGAFTIQEKDGSMPLGSTPLTNHRGNYRLPPSHRLDLGMTNHKPKRHGERIWSLGIYNAYNRKNPNLVLSVATDEEEGSGPKTISFLPIIPSVGYTRVF